MQDVNLIDENSSSDELENLTYPELLTVAKRQREVLEIARGDLEYGEVNHCCIKGCLEMDIATPFHGSEKVRVCGSCDSKYCSDHHDSSVVPYSGVICPKCDEADFICGDCFEKKDGPFICVQCSMIGSIAAKSKPRMEQQAPKKIKVGGRSD
jgi:hypothetical protein